MNRDVFRKLYHCQFNRRLQESFPTSLPHTCFGRLHSPLKLSSSSARIGTAESSMLFHDVGQPLHSYRYLFISSVYCPWRK